MKLKYTRSIICNHRSTSFSHIIPRTVSERMSLQFEMLYFKELACSFLKESKWKLSTHAPTTMGAATTTAIIRRPARRAPATKTISSKRMDEPVKVSHRLIDQLLGRYSTSF